MRRSRHSLIPKARFRARRLDGLVSESALMAIRGFGSLAQIEFELLAMSTPDVRRGGDNSSKSQHHSIQRILLARAGSAAALFPKQSDRLANLHDVLFAHRALRRWRRDRRSRWRHWGPLAASTAMPIPRSGPSGVHRPR